MAFTREYYNSLSSEERNRVDAGMAQVNQYARNQIDRERAKRQEEEEDWTPGSWEAHLDEDEISSSTRAMYLDSQRSKNFSGKGYDIEDEMRYLNSQGLLDSPQQKAAKAAKAAADAKAKSAAPAPKPKGDQQIDPVKPAQESPEISAARQIANSYQAGLKDKKSPWEQAQADANSSSFGAQNQTDFTSKFNPSGSDDTPQMSQEATDLKNKAQSFADKYKLDLISSGATKNQFGS